MKKIILAAAVIAALSAASFAFDMSGLENAAAEAKIAAQTGSLESASGIADMSFSGSMATDDKGAVAITSAAREEVKKDMAVTMNAKADKQPLAKKVPGLVDSAKSAVEKNEFGFLRLLGLAVVSPIIMPVMGALVGAIQASNAENLFLTTAGFLLGAAAGIVLAPIAMVVLPVLGLYQLFKGKVY